jgi:hypothetical protein
MGQIDLEGIKEEETLLQFQISVGAEVIDVWEKVKSITLR